MIIAALVGAFNQEKALVGVGAFNQEKALVGAFSVIVQFRRLIVCSTAVNTRNCTVEKFYKSHSDQ